MKSGSSSAGAEQVPTWGLVVAAAYVGISPFALRTLASEGLVPCLDPRAPEVRFNPADLLYWMDRGPARLERLRAAYPPVLAHGASDSSPEPLN